jgi:hypothetical protein
MKQSSANESKKLPIDTDSQFLSYHPIYPPGLPTLKEILESRLSSTSGKANKVAGSNVDDPQVIFDSSLPQNELLDKIASGEIVGGCQILW